jgi:RNA-binding protein with serine-rich domain 1
VRAEHLKEIFGYFGTIINIQIDRDRNGFPKGTAAVTLATEKDAEHAMFYLDGGQIDGNIIKVSFVLMDNATLPTDKGKLIFQIR